MATKLQMKQKVSRKMNRLDEMIERKEVREENFSQEKAEREQLLEKWFELKAEMERC